MSPTSGLSQAARVLYRGRMHLPEPGEKNLSGSLLKGAGTCPLAWTLRWPRGRHSLGLASLRGGSSSFAPSLPSSPSPARQDARSSPASAAARGGALLASWQGERSWPWGWAGETEQRREQEINANSPVGLSGETGAQAERCRACGERRGMQGAVGLVSGARAPVDVRVLLVFTCKRGDLCEKRVRSVRWVRGARCIQRLLQACCASRARSSRGGCGDCHELIRRILFYNRCHSNGEAGSSLPPDPSASSAARPAKLRDHLLIRATGWSPPRCRCPSPGLRPPCGEGRQPPGTGSRARIQHLGEGWRG